MPLPEGVSEWLLRLVRWWSDEASRKNKSTFIAPHPRAQYLVVLEAMRFNPEIKRLYERLVASGKHRKVALTACIRKMVAMLNAMVRDNVRWQEKTA